MKKKQITIKDKMISVRLSENENDYISLTDIARFKNEDDPRYAIQNWMKTRFTVEFLGIWERMHNLDFKRVEFDAFMAEAGANAFVLTPQKWIKKTGAVGIRSSAGRYGGTYAHKDIAFEFATWISPEFKLYLIKEFQRLKTGENERLALGWDMKRMLTKVNYRIHTDAIRDKIILPQKLSVKDTHITYATEADVLNMALFGMTAKEWKRKHPKKPGNMRDYADVAQLVCLANLENLNAEYIRAGMPQGERLLALNRSAIVQMKSFTDAPGIRHLKGE